MDGGDACPRVEELVRRLVQTKAVSAGVFGPRSWIEPARQVKSLEPEPRSSVNTDSPTAPR